MNELVEIFKRNNWKQNLSWFGNILVFVPWLMIALFYEFVLKPIWKKMRKAK